MGPLLHHNLLAKRGMYLEGHIAEMDMIVIHLISLQNTQL